MSTDNLIVIRVNGVRMKVYARLVNRTLLARVKVAEAVICSLVIFTVFFTLPLAFGCRECPVNPLTNSSACEYKSHRPHVQHMCAYGKYNELATLLLSGQEGMLNHLLSRHEDLNEQPPFSIVSLGAVLVCYMVVASLSFGIHLPAGNFVPGIAIGGTLGRLMGQVLVDTGLNAGWSPGAYALLGAAAVLSGMTRMTLTLAAILVEAADDIRMMPKIMLTLCVANIVAERLSISFDEAMMKLQGLPFLAEAPPAGLSMLTAQNAMASPVIVLPEVVQVGFLVGVLDNTTHNGYPVVRLDVASLPSDQDEGDHLDQTTVNTGKSKFCGLILRRQLMVLLQERVWEYQHAEKELPSKLVERYVGSFTDFADADLVRGPGTRSTDTSASIAASASQGRQGHSLQEFCKLSAYDLQHLLDLRSFMDPSPLTVSKLTPLSRVYRLFNEIGVRHLPVLDPKHRLSGIITRKDLHIESMENTIMRLAQVDLGADKDTDASQLAEAARQYSAHPANRAAVGCAPHTSTRRRRRSSIGLQVLTHEAIAAFKALRTRHRSVNEPRASDEAEGSFKDSMALQLQIERDIAADDDTDDESGGARQHLASTGARTVDEGRNGTSASGISCCGNDLHPLVVEEIRKCNSPGLSIDLQLRSKVNSAATIAACAAESAGTGTGIGTDSGTGTAIESLQSAALSSCTRLQDETLSA